MPKRTPQIVGPYIFKPFPSLGAGWKMKNVKLSIFGWDVTENKEGVESLRRRTDGGRAGGRNGRGLGSRIEVADGGALARGGGPWAGALATASGAAPRGRASGGTLLGR